MITSITILEECIIDGKDIIQGEVLQVSETILNDEPACILLSKKWGDDFRIVAKNEILVGNALGKLEIHKA
jgi:hypothetical protein